MKSDRLHIVNLRESGAKFPLYCFPGGGEGVSIFRDMVNCLPENRPVYGIDFDKIYGTVTQFTVEDLATSYLRIIRSNQEHGPYHFCGYSFGGIVAYEVATLLEKEGEEVALLAMLDTSNPALRSALSPAASLRFRKKYFADRVKKYLRNFLLGNVDALKTDVSYFLSSKVVAIHWRLTRTIHRLFNQSMSPSFRHNAAMLSAAWHAYIPPPYNQRIVIFRSERRGPEYDDHLTLGWNTCAIGGIDVHVVPGGHLNMLNKPYVSHLAERLTAYLEEGYQAER